MDLIGRVLFFCITDKKAENSRHFVDLEDLQVKVGFGS